MPPTLPLNKLEKISREFQQRFIKSPRRWPCSGVLARPKRISSFSSTNEHKYDEIQVVCHQERPYILELPLEVLQTIAELLPTPSDAIRFARSCKDIRTQLGPENRYFWYQILKAKVSKYKRFNNRTNYYSVVLDHIAGKLKGCQVCLSQGKNCDIRISGIFYRSLCFDCKKQTFWDWHHTRTKYPEITFPETLKATCATHGPCLHRPSIHIAHAVQIIEEQSIKPLPSFKHASQPENRFLAKWNFRLDKLQELGISIVSLTSFLTNSYAELYTDFHVLKTPAQFRQFIELRFLEVVSDPSARLHSRYPQDLYERLYNTAIRLMCFRSGSYKTLSKETSVATGDILYELLGTYTVASPFFPSTKKPILLYKWIKDYISDHPEKSFRGRNCLGRFTWCCFCRLGSFDKAGDAVLSDANLQMLKETAYSRIGLAEHIFKYHNHRFAQRWEWCPVQ